METIWKVKRGFILGGQAKAIGDTVVTPREMPHRVAAHYASIGRLELAGPPPPARPRLNAVEPPAPAGIQLPPEMVLAQPQTQPKERKKRSQK